MDEREFGIGSIFNVTNTSADTFLGVYVDLYSPDADTPFYSVNLGDIDGGLTAQSIDDLSFLSVPFDLDRATLRLGYLASVVNVTLGASDLIGDPTSFLVGSTEIQTIAHVTEPATWMVLSAGAVGMVLTRRRRNSV